MKKSLKKRILTVVLVATLILGLSVGIHAQTSLSERSEQVAKQANINWQQFKGEAIHLGMLRSVLCDWQLEMVPEFEKLTGIKITYEDYAENALWQKQLLDLSTGAGGFDYMMMGPFYAPRYVKEKWVADLSQFVNDPNLCDKEWYDYGDVLTSIREAYNVGGYIASIPLDGVTHVLFYRKDIFDKYGITVPKTMDGLLSVAEKLTLDTNTDGKIDLYGISLRGSWLAVTQPAFLYTYGGGFLDNKFRPLVNNQQTISGAKRYVSLAKNYGPPGTAGKVWSDVLEDFRAGLTAMTVDTIAWATQFENPEKSKIVGKVGVAKIPGLTPQEPGEPGWWSWSVGISNYSKHKKAAWLYLMWTTSKVQSLRFALKRGVTGRTWVTQQPEYLDLVGKLNFGNWLDCFRYGMGAARGDYLVTQIAGKPIPEAPEIIKKLQIEVSAAIAGQKTVEQALSDADRGIEETMEKAGYYR
jgi:multiple sugar transport system substrate-binding protein